MSQKHVYRPETADFVDTAPVRFVVQRELPCSAARLFEIFQDADAWTRWAGLKSVVWTSPLPVSAGTTRDAQLGPVTVDEEFTAWVPGERMTFYFRSGSSKLIRAGVEDYRITTVEAHPGRCHLSWHFGLEVGGLGLLLRPFLSFAMKRECGRALVKLERYILANAG